MSWRLALRLARREMSRRPSRTVLVVLLVAIPVAGMTLAVVLFRTDKLSQTDEFHRDYGAHVDAIVPESGALAVPAGSEVHGFHYSTRLNLDGPKQGRLRVTGTDAPLTGDFQGRQRLLEGSAPEAANEVALSRTAADDAGVEVGDDVAVAAERQGAEVERVTVVGMVEDPTCLDCRAVILHPDSSSLPNHPSHNLIRLPDDVTEAELSALAQHGVLDPALRPDSFVIHDDLDDTTGVMWSWVIGAVALTAAGVVISAAFAVSARRQLTVLGQLSAAGASHRLLRTTLALQGTVAGFLGLIVGWTMSAAILGLGRGQLEEVLGRRLPAWDLRPAELAVAAIIGIVAATVAALLPARTAARVPTLAALAGRRPLAPVPRWLTVSGLVAIVVGLGLLSVAALRERTRSGGEIHALGLIAVAGGILQLLGACAITPALAARLEPFAARVHGPARLAARSLARNRTRTGAVVAAIAVSAALAVFAGGMVRGRDDRALHYDYDLPDDVAVAGGVGIVAPQVQPPLSEAAMADIDDVLPNAEQVTIRRARFGSGGDPAGWRLVGDRATRSSSFHIDTPLIADEAVLDVLGVPAEVRDLVQETGLVWGGETMDGGELHAAVIAPDRTEYPVAIVDPSDVPAYLDAMLVSPELVESLQLDVVDTAVALRSPDPLTAEQRDNLNRLMASSDDVEVWHQSDDETVTPVQVEMLLAAAALVVTLFVIATSLALTAAESRDEREVLAVVGSRPRDLARAAGVRAALLAGLGAALAIPLGLATYVVVSRSWDPELPIRPPWLSMALLLFMVPMLATVAATVASTIAQRLRPISVSTATFD